MASLTLRRLRDNPHIRGLVRDVRLDTGQFIQPLFVVEGLAAREPVAGLAGVWRETTDSLARQVEADLAAGVAKFLLFAVPAGKGERDFRADFGAAAIAGLKRRFGHDIWLAADVCLCSSTTHGHCGVLNEARDHVDNGATVGELARAAAILAGAGADCVAPSDMMDGRIAAIRAALDGAGLERTVLLSYAAKFHSAFYGPFRLAASSAPSRDGALRDRATYQLDPARSDDALASAKRDLAEGADLLMVKPGLPCLDVLARLRDTLPVPWAVYQTSGEQAGLELLAGAGLADGERAQLETWLAFARAGARIIVSYAARRAPALLAAAA